MIELKASRAKICRRVRDQESRSKNREELNGERLLKLETMVYAQHEKLDRLEGLVYRVMHRDRVGTVDDGGLRSTQGLENIEQERSKPPDTLKTQVTTKYHQYV